ncbi:FAD-dependent monooxygenase [Agromyces laixinhei]|nr:FAD-dependent monooxygenase [Agromyces laixinhei]
MSERVLVVGGGVAGFGAARALSLRGVPYTLVERLETPPPTSVLGINLPGNAVRALDALGVGDEAVRSGRPIVRREYRTSSGRLLFDVDERDFWKGVASSVCLRRSTLLDLLRAGTDPATVRWGNPLVRAESAGATVRVRLGNGAAEAFGFVVGADGVHSTTRGAVTGEAGLQPSRMSSASWRFQAPNPGVACWTAWTGRDGTFLLIPIDDKHVYGYASTTRRGAAIDNPDWLANTSRAFPAPVRDAVDAALTHPGRPYHSPVEVVRAERWSLGRIALIGDAAHSMGPVWAQGAGLALEDALVLAGLLAERSDWTVVGAEFERLRRPRVELVEAATERLSRLAGLPIWLRNLVGPVLGPRTYQEAYGPLRAPLSSTV